MTGRPEHPRLGEGDFWALQAAGDWSLPFELIAGEPVVIPPLSEAELAARVEVRWHLRRWQQHRGDHGLQLHATPVALPGETWVVPDLAYWSSDRLPQKLHQPDQPVPDLIVFIQRYGTPDPYEQKRLELSREAGIADVWTVQPARLRIRTARLGVRLGEDMVLSPTLPGFHMSAFQPFLTRPESPVRRETLLKHLAAVLVEHPTIRTAVLIGSVARDDHVERGQHQDIDLLLDYRDGSFGEHARLRQGIEDATGLEPHFVALSWAMEERAGLIEAAVEQGTALVDRDGAWEAIRTDVKQGRASAQDQGAELDAGVGKVLDQDADDR